MDSFLNDKVDKAELKTALPNMSLFKEEMLSLTNSSIRNSSDQLTQQMKQIDTRLVNLRRDTNIENFKQLLNKKADNDQM